MKRMTRKALEWVTVGALVAGAASPAVAEGTGIYAVAGIGVVTLDRTQIAIIGAPGSYGDQDTGVRVGLGLRLSQNMAMEVSLQTLGEFGAATPTLETTAYTMWLVGLAPLSQSLSLQGKLGATVFQSDVGTRSDTGGNMSFGVGLNYRMLERLDITYEYERFQANVFVGKTSYDVYSAGLKYHF